MLQFLGAVEGLLWIVFLTVVAVMLFIDLEVINRRAHVISVKEAASWSAVWIGAASVFNMLVFFTMGEEQGLRFLTGYVIEKSLSVDNLFVFLMIFSYFQVPARYQPRVLKWGILGALGMRAALILAGVTALDAFHWMIYIFGSFLIVTGFRMLRHREKKVDPAKNSAVKLVRRLMPVTKNFVEGKFFTRVNGVLCATPLFIVLVTVETSDLMFAVDSIPAVLAITTDPFIVYTSNVFALLGLRALYFLLAGIMSMFIHLSAGLSIILIFIGFKMVAADFYKIPVEVTLIVVVGILTASILASMLQKTTAHIVEVRKLSSR